MGIFGDLEGPLVAWLIIPLFIFAARIFDVSVSTLRIILLGKGFRIIASILGFLEAMVWITAVTQIMQNLNNFYYYFIWGLGFACGTYVGMMLETKLSLGQVVVRIITKYDATALMEHLQESNYHVTAVDAQGSFDSNVKVIFIVIKRHDLREAIKVIKQFNPNAVYTVEDLRLVSEGFFPREAKHSFLKNLNPLKRFPSVRK